MKFGLFAINMGPCSDPVTAVRVAQAAEAAGFESVWTGEHIVLPDPDPQVPASPVPSGIGHQSRRRLAQHLDPKSALLDPAVSLAFVAAHTQRVKLGTGIIILPQRNPLVLAKELASVDVRSEEHTSELQSQSNLVCRLLLEKKKPRHSPPSTYPSRSSHVPVP